MEDADYVVVGAGSAGCVVANRLSADGRSRVLVLEAGGSDRKPWVMMPIGYGMSFYHPDLNWRYTSEPQPGLGGRTLYCPRGRVLGGSSSINAMVFIRGQREDYDGWEKLGNPGWGYRDVLPAFRRMEDNMAGADQYRGTGGPRNRDFNGETQEGVGIYQITTRNGLRASAATAYLHPAMRRSNLEVVTRAQVTCILFEGRRAVGVEYRRNGGLHVVRARAEIVLSAGAVNSPQILQLSGVGDPALLKVHGLGVVHAAPQVGENLQDHLGVDHLYRSRRPTLNDVLRPWRGQLAVGVRYFLTRGGPLSLNVNQGGGFFRGDPKRDRPNLQLYFSPLSYIKAVPGKRQLMRPDPYPGFLIGVSNCHPTSRGHIRIRSADPFEAPSIQPNYLSTQEDLDEFVDGALFLRRLAAQAPLAALIEEELQPGAQAASRAEIEDDIRKRSSSIFHASGTCAMGPDPATSVVDARLQVHGLDGLRVIDASVFPRITSGNINAPAIMVGERGADFLIADRR